MSRCECPAAGWCERHQVAKGERMHELCDHPDHPAYWKAWESGYGPGQIRTGDPRAAHKPDPVCIHRGTIAGTAECGCAGKPKVYQCDLHGFAMDRKLKPGRVPVVMEYSKQSVDMRYCNACDDFEAVKITVKQPKAKTVAVPPITDVAVEPQRSDLAIVSIAVGNDTTELSAITFPRFRQYAEHVNADFIEVTDDQFPLYPLANKFRIGAIAAKYRRAIFLDADIWLRGSVGNLFDLFAAGSVWMHPDIEQFEGARWAVGQSAKMAREQGISPNRSRVYNTGVVIFDQDHCGIWSPPPKPMGIDHVAEQFWVEHQALDVGVSNLGWEYNCQWYWPKFRELEPLAKIIHLANCSHGERIKRLRKLESTDASFV